MFCILFAQAFYKTYNEALQDTSKGNLIGFIQFSPNFTKSLTLFNDDGVDVDISDNGIIQVFLDQTDIQKAAFIRRKLYEAYQKFTESLMVDCGKSKKAGNTPIVFEAAFGDLNFDLRLTIIPGIILA
jgi:hypothetical protein